MTVDVQIRRRHFLDSLRGLAAVYVVFFHTLFVPRPNPALGDILARQAVGFGGTGVYLFFLISGFSLSLTMPRHDKSGNPTLSFASSRFFRIAPLFYGLSFLLLAREIILYAEPVHLKPLVLNPTFLFNLVPGQQEGIVPASWTIGVEMLFYASFIPLYRKSIGFQVGAGLLSLAIFGLEVVFLPKSYSDFSFIGFFPLFLFGMWSFDIYDRLSGGGRSSRRLGWTMIAVGSVLLILCAMPHHVDGALLTANKNIYLRLPIGLGYALLLVGCGLLELRLMAWRLLTFYGRISYSLYLLHPLVIGALLPVFGWIAANTRGDAGYWLDAGLALTVTTMLAYLTHRLIEIPGVRLGDHVLRFLTACRYKPLRTHG